MEKEKFYEIAIAITMFALFYAFVWIASLIY